MSTVIYPLEPNIDNEAEKIVYEKLAKFLSKEHVTYYNYTVTGKEFDFCILEKNKAIFIIEVKGWENIQIINVKDNETISYRDRFNNIKEWSSPFKQVRGYKFDMINEIKRKFNKKPLVIGMVCYPFITLDKFKEKSLHIISDEKLTILKDDLKSEKSLEKKMNDAFKLIGCEKRYDDLDKSLVKDIRSLYESESQIQENSFHIDFEKNDTIYESKNITYKIHEDIDKIEVEEMYSLLKYVKNNKSEKEILNLVTYLMALWKKGTKIILTSDNDELLENIKKIINDNLGYLNNYDNFKIISDKGKYESMIYNFSFVKVSEELKDEFEVIDGITDSKTRTYLEELHNKGNFNLHQYELEHSDLKKDICVRAGAGSGKTFSMIGRINYLIYKHRYTFENIEEKLVLITFTNDAADNMKKKLKEYYENYYLLTCNYDSFKMIEAIERVNISTIHSLCKKILSKYSVQLGIGKSIQIVQGKYEKDQVIKEKLNEYLKKNFKKDDNPIEELGMQMFQIQKMLSGLLEKIEQKNIDLREEYLWGQANNEKLHNLIINVIKETQEEIIKINDERSSIRLSNIIIRLNELIKNGNLKKDDVKIEYLFVDEFQDSDNVQIEMMKEFRKIYKFNFFVVGDVKQCIYRFRGAEDQAFDMLLKEDEGNWEQFKLVKNYRTDKKLLDKFHLVFDRMNRGGILKYSASDDRLIGTINLNSINYDFFHCKSICNEEERISKLVECIKEEKKTLNCGEKIAILVRTNKEIEVVREVCKREGIGIATEGYGDLYQIKPTYDLYKLILALKNYKDPKYIFGIYDTNFTNKCMPKNQVFNFRKDRDKLYEYFQKDMPIKNWNKYIENLKLQPIMKVVREIINSTAPWENYCDENIRDKEVATNMKNYYKKNLEQLIEIIVKKFNNDYVTLNKVEEFLRIMIFTRVNQESREEIDIEEITENILCTTIHKSKGLEYDVVIMPFCDTDISCKSSKGNIDIIVDNRSIGYSIKTIRDNEDKSFYDRFENNIYANNSRNERTYKMHEEARILYVGMTRTIRKFVWFNNIGTKVKENWQKIIGGY